MLCMGNGLDHQELIRHRRPYFLTILAVPSPRCTPCFVASCSFSACQTPATSPYIGWSRLASRVRSRHRRGERGWKGGNRLCFRILVPFHHQVIAKETMRQAIVPPHRRRYSHHPQPLAVHFSLVT